MITSLLIDDTECLSYLLYDEVNKLTWQVDEGINSPLCPIYEFSLENRDGLEEVFLKNYPYNLFEEAMVELYWDEDLVFKGYVDKDNSRILKNAETLDVYAVSIEKKIGVMLAGHDITQLYYNKDGSIPVRQRGGREGIAVRHSSSNYNDIEDLLGTMFADVSITCDVDYRSKYEYFPVFYRYNEEKFGPIAEQQTIGVYRNTGDRGYSAPWYNRIIEYKRNETDTESYDTLIKEFAKMTGCSFFYMAQEDKYYFVPRNSLFGEGIEIDQLMLYDPEGEDYEIPIKYKNAYNGVIVEFDDVSFLVKFEVQDGVLSYVYGLDAQEYEIVQLENGEYFVYLIDNYGLTLGVNYFNSSLFIENGLKIKMNGRSWDYLEMGLAVSPFPTGTRVDLFLQMLLLNYNDTLFFFKELETKLNGCYFPPFKANLAGRDVACWYGEIDFIAEETLIKMDIVEFEYKIPAESFLVVEDDVFVLD